MMHEQLIASIEIRIKNHKAYFSSDDSMVMKNSIIALQEDEKTIAELLEEVRRKDRQLEKGENEYLELRAENERLKGKIVTPDVTTICHCRDCGAATRMGRHLDMDCDTIRELREFKDSMPTVIAQAVSDALAQSDEQHKADADVELLQLREKLALVESFLNMDCEDLGVKLLQDMVKGAIENPEGAINV